MGGRPKLTDIQLAEAARICALSEEEFLRRQTRATASRYRKTKVVPLDAVAVVLLRWWRDQTSMIVAERTDARRELINELMGRLPTMVSEDLVKELRRLA